MQFLQHKTAGPTSEFSDFDSRFRFNTNRMKGSKKWPLYNYKILYKKNSQGFTTYEFDDVNWNVSFIVLGCSNVFGLGLREEHTFIKLLEEKLDRPVINLGINGSAVDTACYNSFELFKSGKRPKGIIQIWTSLSRYMISGTLKLIGFILHLKKITTEN